MNTFFKIPLVLAVGVAAATGVSAGLESYKVELTYVPQLSPVMLMDGITEGKVIFAIDLSEEGKVTDWLVLGYTHPSMVRPYVDALQQWKFTPARLDGVPVSIQTKLTVNYTAEGVVVSRPAVMDLDLHMQRIFGYRLSSRPRTARELDQPPTPIATVAPKYAKQAEEQGVRGVVRVHFYIDETGAVRMPAVDGDAHPYLSEMALAAMREWRFTPPTAKGKPVLIAARQDFNFSSN